MSYPLNFERAVECGERYGLCNVDELERLAEELETYQGSFFEKTQELQEKEIQDRKDLAEVLHLQAELIRRQDYLKKANLFEEDVKVFHDMKERDEFVENLDYLDT
jgi:superfamily I DNA/RNA helicase